MRLLTFKTLDFEDGSFIYCIILYWVLIYIDYVDSHDQMNIIIKRINHV